MNQRDTRIKIFGAALDVLDGQEKVGLKQAYMAAICAKRDLGLNYPDPFEALMEIGKDVFEGTAKNIGKIPVASWLTPKPPCEDLSRVTPENYKAFLESGGCRRHTDVVDEFVDRILPDPFIMVGVDHSQTGGVLKGLSRYYGSGQVSVVVLDAHMDLFDFDVLAPVHKALQEQTGVGSFPGEGCYGRSFYGCGNFLKHMLEYGVILPENLFLAGVTDSPNQVMKESTDPGIKKFMSAYEDLTKQGINIISRSELEGRPNRLRDVLERMDTPYAYISIDMDVGAVSSTNAVRFLNTIGLNEKAVYDTVTAARDVMDQKHIRCLGFDLMEMDAHFAGASFNGIRDRSYDIALDIIRILIPALQAR